MASIIDACDFLSEVERSSSGKAEDHDELKAERVDGDNSGNNKASVRTQGSESAASDLPNSTERHNCDVGSVEDDILSTLVLDLDFGESGDTQTDGNGLVKGDDMACEEEVVIEPPNGLCCEAEDITHNSLKIQWKPPQHENARVKYYKVTCTYKDEDYKHQKLVFNEPTTSCTINFLPVGSTCQFSVQAVYKTGVSEPCSITARTRPASPPGQPKLTQTSPIFTRIEWDPPSVVHNTYRVTSYQVLFQNEGEENWENLVTIYGNKTSVETMVISNQPVRCIVIAHSGKKGSSKASRESEPFTLETNDSDRMKARLLKQSHIIEKGGCFTVFQPHAKCTISAGTIKKVEIGKPKAGKRNFVIMVVGATGSGKTTLINGMINYIFGVEWKDAFRHKLIVEPNSGNQARSQTDCLTAYTINHQEGFQVPYTLTIIDTPGFGDTSGVMRDKQITEDIRKFFTTAGDDGIDHIDAVGFVTQSSLPRLTPTQRYIFDQILSLFGKDIEQNIFLMLTFADAQKPQVLSGLKEAHMPYQKFFKFNNSALYANNTSSGNNDDEEEDDEDTEDGNCSFDEMFWDMGIKSYKSFFKSLGKVQTRSLMLTKDVLTERQQLEAHIVAIQQDIQLGLSKLDQLQVEIEVVRRHQADIDKNKDFTYVVEQDKIEAVQLSRGIHVTNCTHCNRTCHDNCIYADDSQKANCCAMSNGYCTVCTGKCHWKLHKNMPYKYELRRERIQKTSDDLKQRYQEGMANKLSAEKLMEQIDDDFCQLQLKVMNQTDEVRKSLQRLHSIALRPNPLSTLDYIDILIDSEKAEARPGHRARVNQLMDIRGQVQYLQKVADEGFDPWEKYKEQMEKKRKDGVLASVWTTLGKLKVFNIFKRK